jgi:hypothetical protein
MNSVQLPVAPNRQPTSAARALLIFCKFRGANSCRARDSLRLSATFSDRASTGPAFSWHDKRGEYAELTCARRPVVRYMCRPPDPKNVEETCKVFHHVYDPAGTRFVIKGPGGLYTHHRGLFFGYCNIT